MSWSLVNGHFSLTSLSILIILLSVLQKICFHGFGISRDHDLFSLAHGVDRIVLIYVKYFCGGLHVLVRARSLLDLIDRVALPFY